MYYFCSKNIYFKGISLKHGWYSGESACHQCDPGLSPAGLSSWFTLFSSTCLLPYDLLAVTCNVVQGGIQKIIAKHHVPYKFFSGFHCSSKLEF